METINLRLFSTSTVHGSGYLDYCQEAVQELFEGKKEVLFIPYARPGGITHDEYTAVATKRFEVMGFQLTGIHMLADPIEAVRQSEGIFIGGGNTFLLLKTLYEEGLTEVLRSVVRNGVPYMGTSAGSNVAGNTISTTNDMPIVYPPSFEALSLVPFNLNPHYLDPVPGSTHMGETRETRIREFHHFNKQVVVGLREGSWLMLKNGLLTLEGELSARIFRAGQAPEEIAAGSDLKFLLS